MTRTFELQGAWTAIATPFGADGAVQMEALRKLLDFQIDQGIDGIVPCGTTGESPTLKPEEQYRIIEVTVAAADGRLGVLVGTGGNDTAKAIHMTKEARARGASAALLVDCYYNGPSSLELRTRYYERVLSEVPDIPIVPYVIPGRSACALGAEDLAILHLTDPRRVPAVKQATGDLDRMRRDRELCGPGLAIMSGDDDMTLAMMRDPAIASSGVISVMTNLFPAAIKQMVVAQSSGDAARASALAEQLAPVFKLVGCKAEAVRKLPDGRSVTVEDKFKNPVPVKTMMAGLGMLGPACRSPLGSMTVGAVAICRDALRRIHAGAPELLAPIGAAFDVDVARRLGDDSVWSALVAA